ncbi:MAG: pyridoxal phosphate-dependent aminotransferase [Eubacteriales bacterium]|nr:pyridoxal phosphate-dependent aminotransferase [Eubacteriales bacterium]
MLNQNMLQMGRKRSVIREIFEFSRARANTVGAENVYDFSLGNPSIPAPKEVEEAIVSTLQSGDSLSVHGYTSAGGADWARAAIAASLGRRFHTEIGKDDLYLTCGASAALSAVFRALTIGPHTQFVAIAPFFPEYRYYVGEAKLVVAQADTKHFQIDLVALENAITEDTQAVIVNSPNNPTGVIYTEETLLGLSALLSRKSAEYAHTIYIVSDEPYRELVYDGAVTPYIPHFYKSTIVCYSYSKALSIPGERIGYVLIPREAENARDVYDAVAGGARSLGYSCAPALFQAVAARCADVKPDIEAYRKNREALYNGLAALGYECVKPSGAFYLFVKAPGGDADAFCQNARLRDVFMVPGVEFGYPTNMRVSYCVAPETIERALPVFGELIREFQR